MAYEIRPSFIANTGSMSDSRKLYKRIADSIAAEISSGVYKPGDRLPTERDLAVQYSVSRPSIREALIVLEMLGLIEAKQGLGITVAKESAQTPAANELEIGAFELIEARRILEAEVAAFAAPLITDADLEEMESLIEQMGDADLVKAERADRQFHQVIVHSTGNGALIASVENLWDWRYRSPLARNILARAADLGMKNRIAEHTKILDALKARNSAQARQAMRDHMDRVLDHLLAATEIVEVENIKKSTSDRRRALAKRISLISND